MNSEFHDDGQHISDEEWITYGLRNGWGLLTQDGRIRYRAAELAALAGGRCGMFCLSSGNLTIAAKIDRFHDNQAVIYNAMATPRAAFYTVYTDSIRKKWP